MSNTVWITRHGNREDFVDPDWAASAVWPDDPGLSPDGVAQAERLAARLAVEDIGHIFASPFLRTVHTASIVAEELDKPVYLEPGLGEWMNPNWYEGPPELRAPSRLAEIFPRIDLSYKARRKPSYPETEEEALRRAGDTARRLVKAYERPILIVGHGASVAGVAEGLVPGAEVTECALCSVFRIVRRAGMWRLDLRGDVSHLDEAVGIRRFN